MRESRADADRSVHALSNLGDRFRECRQRRGLSIRRMAAAMGVVPGTIVRLEKGDPGISAGVLWAALAVLGIEHQFSRLAIPDVTYAGRPTTVTPRREIRPVAAEVTTKTVTFDPCFD